jgi:hypothetical protein
MFGVIAIEVKTGAVTVKTAELLMVPDVAVMVALPLVKLVASPLELTVATVVADEVQLAMAERFWVEPLLYVPVAVNCWEYPAAVVAVPGVTEIAVKTAAVTVNAEVPEIPPEVAVMVLEPCAIPVASPVLLIVEIVVEDEVQTDVVERFCLDPLL